MKKKGFTFIIMTTIFISFITLLFILNTPIPTIENDSGRIAKNYIQELSRFSKESNYEDINSYNNYMDSFARAHNNTLHACNIIDDQEEKIIISNFLGEDCTLYIDGEETDTISSQSIERDRFINDTNIYLCYCNILKSGTKSYYVSVQGPHSRTVYNN